MFHESVVLSFAGRALIRMKRERYHKLPVALERFQTVYVKIKCLRALFMYEFWSVKS